MYLIPKRLEIEKRRNKKGLSAYGLAMKAGLDKKAIYRIKSEILTAIWTTELL